MNDVIKTFNKNYYSRWLTTEELLNNGNGINIYSNSDDITSSGLPVGSIDNKYIVDTTISHNLIIGANGSGKTQSVVLPMLYMSCKANESVIVKDIKGELYKQTASLFKNNGYEVIAIDFNEPNKGNSWNPLSLPTYLYKNGKKDDASDIVDCFTKSMMTYEKGSDPFWSNTSSAYASGLLLSLMELANEEEVNLYNLSKLTTISDEELLDAYISKIDRNSVIFNNIASTYLAPSETKTSILSVLNQKLSLYTNKQELTNMLSSTDFDFNNLKDKKVIVYLITSPEVEQNDTLINTFISQACYLLNNNKKVFNIILDEFDSSVNQIPNINNLLSNARSNYVRFTLLINGLMKLNKVYGRETVESLKLSCQNILYLLSNEIETLNYVSQLCGTTDNNKSLVSVEALKRIPVWNCIFIKQRYMPYATTVLPFYKLPIEKIEELEISERTKKNLKIIDLEKYINE